MENKYSFIKEFPHNTFYTENYSDIDFYQSIHYDEFQQILRDLDFSQYTVGEVKQLVKK